MMVPLTTWLWIRGEGEVIEALWTVILAAGLMVLALYGLDRYLHLEQRDVESTEREALYRDQQNGAQS